MVKCDGLKIHWLRPAGVQKIRINLPPCTKDLGEFMKKLSEDKSKIKVNSSKKVVKKAVRKNKQYDIPIYGQSEEFTSSAACVMMIMKYLDRDYKFTKDDEYEIWNETVYGSVLNGSRYGIAYALAKRGIQPIIMSTNVKDLGYERKIAVYEGINLNAMQSAFDEVKEKMKAYDIKEIKRSVTVNTIKKYMSENMIPIVLVNSSVLNMATYTDSFPQWVVVKGYDEDTFYVNDSYSDSVLAMEPETFVKALGYENEYYMILVKASRAKPKKNK